MNCVPNAQKCIQPDLSVFADELTRHRHREWDSEVVFVLGVFYAILPNYLGGANAQWVSFDVQISQNFLARWLTHLTAQLNGTLRHKYA